MRKEEFVALGLSEEVATFVTSDKRNNKALNQEGLAIGDTITITGVADKVTEQVIDGNVRQWVDVLTTGDRNSISIARLVGTAKRAKYFDKDRADTEFAPDKYDANKVLALPNREADALKAVMENCVGHTYKVVAIAEKCGQFDQTFYLFAEV